LVAVSDASYPAAESNDQSAPKHWPGALDTYGLVVRNLKIETAPLLKVTPIAATPSVPLSDGVIDGGSAETAVELREAPRDGVIIRQIIHDIYDEGEHANLKPPNIKELPGKVRPRLKARGYKAAGQRIQTIGEAQEFKRRRLQPGRHWRGNR
jgi:hypothetical protein